ncbi:MAG: hypothetical protein Q7K65_04990, partial [Candidatus Buchananbacteria bacterium]|nr:hypothetical protein [Candidatus Buchananbacteria bacterium]
MWTTTGHEKQKEYFKNAIKNSHLNHAYLFSGPDGIGKKMFAYDIFRLVNQREPVGDPDLKLITPRIEDDET